MEKSEYEIQHFGFSAAQVCLERKHVLQKIFGRTLDVIVQELISSSSNSSTAEMLVKEKGEVYRSMQKHLGELLSALEELDCKHFSIPGHVLLATDFEHSKCYTKTDEDRVDDELESLKQQFLNNSIMIESLNVEIGQYESVRSLVCDERNVHQQLEDSFTSIDLTKLVDVVEQTTLLPY